MFAKLLLITDGKIRVTHFLILFVNEEQGHGQCMVIMSYFISQVFLSTVDAFANLV